MQKPQLRFKDEVDNSSSPFVPRIKNKPNAIKPLSISLDATGQNYSHPYDYELQVFKPPSEQLSKVTPQKYRAVCDTPLIFIKRPEDIPGLLAQLKKSKEIAVDLEFHSYRSFQGFTCLMQISTRDTDFIVDTLELRDELSVLNEVFTDPKIVKILHGSTCDILWLQKDMSLYIVNIFDTMLAAMKLKMQQQSLAFLLKHYCGVVVNKKFQLTDWRRRPLHNKLINYAREDTHYLLYIYDTMKNELIDAANGQTTLLLSVIEQSNEQSRKTYKKPVFTEDSYMQLFRRIKKDPKKILDSRHLYAFRNLYNWREKIARDDDESTGYVLPNKMMMKIAEELPTQERDILSLCHPPSPLVITNLHKLHQIFQEAQEQPLTQAVPRKRQQRDTTPHQNQKRQNTDQEPDERRYRQAPHVCMKGEIGAPGGSRGKRRKKWVRKNGRT